eukprot:gene6201-6837_t
MPMKKVAVVTGANKGLGLEIAKKLCEQGVHVILACKNIDHAGIALETFKHNGYDAELRLLDISDASSIQTFVHGIETDFGKLDILINNAAVAFRAHDPTPFEQQARPTVETNYFGTYHVITACLPLLAKSLFPRIVNVASESGHLRLIQSTELRAAFVSPELTMERLNELMSSYIAAVEDGSFVEKGWPSSCYSMSKIGVIAMTQVLAREHPGILINSCCPGYSSTFLTAFVDPALIERAAHTPVYLALLPEKGITGKFLSDENDITASW